MIAPLAEARAQARTPPSPHVAPLPPGTSVPPPNPPYRGTTVWCDLPDGQFNFGETPMGQPSQGQPYIDSGGFLGLDLRTPVLWDPATGFGHVHPYIDPTTGQPEGWRLVTLSTPADGDVPAINNAPLWRFRGYFRPQPLAIGQDVTDGAFEVLASANFVGTEATGKTVLMCQTPPTTGYIDASEGTPGSQDLGRFSYEGWRSRAGMKNEEPLIAGQQGKIQLVNANAYVVLVNDLNPGLWGIPRYNLISRTRRPRSPACRSGRTCSAT
jgi:hypothetical protein